MRQAVEVLHGEIVGEDGQPDLVIGEDRQRRIIDEVQNGANLTTVARLLQLPPKPFRALLNRAENDPRHRLHKFALKVFRAQAEYEEVLRKEMLRLGGEKGKYEAYRVALERQFREDWAPPDKGTTTNVNFNISKKLEQIYSQEELPPGD